MQLLRSCDSAGVGGWIPCMESPTGVCVQGRAAWVEERPLPCLQELQRGPDPYPAPSGQIGGTRGQEGTTSRKKGGQLSFLQDTGQGPSPLVQAGSLK